MTKRCKYLHKSRTNGFLYCKHKAGCGGAYCVLEPGSAGQCFECPLGTVKKFKSGVYTIQQMFDIDEITPRKQLDHP